MQWSPIAKTIGAAEVDVLTLVNSCHAGAAYIPQLDNGRKFAKELITFGGWNELNYVGKLIDPITLGIEKWFKKARDHNNNNANDYLTGERLYQFLAAAIRHKREKELKRYNDYLESVIQSSYPRYYMVQPLGRQIESWKSHITLAKKYYTQPIYTRRYVDWEEDFPTSLNLAAGKETRAWKLSIPFNMKTKEQGKPSVPVLVKDKREITSPSPDDLWLDWSDPDSE